MREMSIEYVKYLFEKDLTEMKNEKKLYHHNSKHHEDVKMRKFWSLEITKAKSKQKEVLELLEAKDG